MRSILVTALAGITLALAGRVPSCGADDEQGKETSYDFNSSDVDIVVQKLSESLLTAEVPGQQKPRIAWLRIRNATEDKNIRTRDIMESVELAIVKSGRFDVVSRTNLEAIAAENALSMTALYDPKAVGQLGSLARVDYWLMGTLSSKANREDGKEFCYYNFTASLTDQQSTAKIW